MSSPEAAATELPEEANTVPFGSEGGAPGQGLTIVPQHDGDRAREAAKALEKEGIRRRVIDCAPCAARPQDRPQSVA